MSRVRAAISTLSLLSIDLIALGAEPVAARSQADATPTGDAVGGATILSPDESHFGQSYGEWSADFQRWSLDFPGAGDDCAAGQAGDVWFLPPLQTDAPDLTATFACAIPSDRAVLVPIVGAWDTSAESCVAGVDLVDAGVGGLEGFALEINEEAASDLDRFEVEPAPLPPSRAPQGTPTAASDASPAA